MILIDKNLQREFGDAYIQEIIKELRSAKKSASNRLINSFSQKLSETSSEINIAIQSEDYLEYIDKGRKRGTYPPIKEIAQWAKLKGIGENAAFPIAKNIYKFGIKPTNVLDKAEKNVLNGPIYTKFEDGIVKNSEEFVLKEYNKIEDIDV
jgi:hypothetical protein